MSVDYVLTNLVGRTLRQLASPLEQLVYLSALYDSLRGKYLHEGWLGVASAEQLHEHLSRAHRQVFREVAQSGIEERCALLLAYFHSLKENPQELGKRWLETEPFREMIPAVCNRVEREFFTCQMRAALEVIARSPSVSLRPEVTALQFPPLDPQLRLQ